MPSIDHCAAIRAIGCIEFVLGYELLALYVGLVLIIRGSFAFHAACDRSLSRPCKESQIFVENVQSTITECWNEQDATGVDNQTAERDMTFTLPTKYLNKH